jgi:hypothetical protein
MNSAGMALTSQNQGRRCAPDQTRETSPTAATMAVMVAKTGTSAPPSEVVPGPHEQEHQIDQAGSQNPVSGADYGHRKGAPKLRMLDPDAPVLWLADRGHVDPRA